MKIFNIQIAIFCAFIVVANGDVQVVNGNDPGTCDQSNHAEEMLVKDRENKEKLIICTENEGVYQWKTIDGENPPGELFNPGYDCSDILDKDEEAKDGFYWIKLDGLDPKKVWCDMTTDGGGFMLIGRKNNSVTWTVPSNNDPVEPFGDPHWSSAFGNAPILDFRVQMATSDDFLLTKAHWSFRLQQKRPLKNLMVKNEGGCDRTSAGIGYIAFVKDLQTENIVTTNLRCSNFGYGHHHLTSFGWTMMNSCLQKPCAYGFAFHHQLPIQTDYSGAFSYSATNNVSGMNHDATAFVGCDNGKCCGCFGPVGGTNDYCTQDCQAMNGGTITSNVFTWFWVRSTLPKRLWKKCMEYKTVRDDGKTIWFKFSTDSAVPTKGRCGKNNALIYDGIVVVPDGDSAKEIPPVAGLMTYRKDSKELYIRANKTWNVIGQKDKILQEAEERAKPNLKEIDQKLKSQEINVTQKFSQLENQLITVNDSKPSRNKVNKKFSQLENQLAALNNTKPSRVKVNLQLNQLKEQLNTMNKTIFSLKVSLHRQGCSGYKWLTDANRNTKYSSSTNLCDNGVSTGWYRFGGDAGTQMPTSCVSKYRCGANAPGWMNGAHPSINEGKVTRTVCYHWDSGCCEWSNNIEVVNCGPFYVYKLSGTPTCNLRYCGRDV